MNLPHEWTEAARKAIGLNAEITETDREIIETDRKSIEKHRFSNRFLDVLYTIGLKIWYLIIFALVIALIWPLIQFVILLVISFFAIKIIFFW